MGARTLAATAERRVDMGGRTLGVAVVSDFSGCGPAKRARRDSGGERHPRSTVSSGHLSLAPQKAILPRGLYGVGEANPELQV
jgi:hypothetical protein